MGFELEISPQKLLAAIKKYQSTTALVPMQKKYLEKLLPHLEQTCSVIAELDEYFAPEDIFGRVGAQLENLEFWNSIESGYYFNLEHKLAKQAMKNRAFVITDQNRATWEARSEILKNLRSTKSKTISELHRATVDVVSLRKFSEKEMTFATELGKSFLYYKNAWSNFLKRCNYVDAEGTVVTFAMKPTAEQLPVLNKLLQLAQRCELIEFSVPQYEDREKKEGLTGFRIFPDKTNKKAIEFMQGHWFEAFAHQIVCDVLERREAFFELYTEVEYYATQPFGGDAHSDFDLLARVNDTVIMVECKSGHFDPSQAEKLVKKTNFLKQTLTSMGARDFLFVLVFSPLDRKPPSSNNTKDEQHQQTKYDELQSALRLTYDNGVKILEPANLAAAFAQYFELNSMPESCLWTPVPQA